MAGYDGDGQRRTGSNGHGPGPNGDRRFDELDALSDEDLELLVGSVEDEDELRTLAESAEEGEGDVGAATDDAGLDLPDERRRLLERDEPAGLIGLRLFPDEEYEPLAGVPDDWIDGAALVDADDTLGEGDGFRTGIAHARTLLAPVEHALRTEGFYAYGTLDDENRWTVAVDDEAGRVDVRLGPDGIVLDLRATSPGLYADVDHPFRRRRLERAAQFALPRVARGYLEPNQAADWDEFDHGIAVTVRYVVPLARAAEVGRIVRLRLPELEDLLALVETRVAD
jgi:hypothetical protein